MTLRKQSSQGFTLIELIMVIVITGILAVVVAPIVSGTFNAYTDSSRRATLVQQAQSIVQRIQYDLSYAVPGSVSVSGNTLSWLALTRDPNPDNQPTGRYENAFDVSSDATSITVLGCAATPPDSGTQYVIIGDDPPGLESGESEWDSARALVKLEDDPGDVAVDQTSCGNSPPRSTINLEEPEDPDETNIFDNSGIGSPFRRLYLTTGEMNIECRNGQILRFSSDNPSDTRLLANNVEEEECELNRNPGTTLTAPTLLIDITLEDEAGEQVRLVRQLQLSNAL